LRTIPRLEAATDNTEGTDATRDIAAARLSRSTIVSWIASSIVDLDT
jgi:hypothetical protein